MREFLSSNSIDYSGVWKRYRKRLTNYYHKLIEYSVEQPRMCSQCVFRIQNEKFNWGYCIIVEGGPSYYDPCIVKIKDFRRLMWEGI